MSKDIKKEIQLHFYTIGDSFEDEDYDNALSEADESLYCINF